MSSANKWWVDGDSIVTGNDAEGYSSYPMPEKRSRQDLCDVLNSLEKQITEAKRLLDGLQTEDESPEDLLAWANNERQKLGIL